jgi:Fur family transcriptional regulator, ferric uptake regulator
MALSNGKINCLKDRPACFKKCTDKECWKNQVKDIGCRITKAREAIMNVLKESTEHYSAEEIYKKAIETYPGIGLATVYRTLEKLCKVGLVNSENFDETSKLYEWSGSKDSKIQIHLMCKKCNKISHHLMDDKLEMNSYLLLMNKIHNENDFQIDKVNIQIDGICLKCSKIL